MVEFLSDLEPRYFGDSTIIYKKGDEVHEFYLIVDGKADVGYFNDFCLDEQQQPKYICPIQYNTG